MMLLAALGTVGFVAIGAVIGARLLLLARRTGERPELYIGGALFVYSLLAQPAILASRPLGLAFGQEVRLLSLGIGMLANTVTICGIYAFTATVFRSESRLAWGVVWAATGTVATCCTWVLFEISDTEIGAAYSTTTKLCVATLCCVFSLGMAWTAVESIRYHGLLKKRLALGLSDPVLVNRFALWGAGCLTCGTLAFAIVVCVAAGMNIVADPIPMLLTAGAGTAIAICWYLSMLAPPAYLRWVRERAERRSASA